MLQYLVLVSALLSLWGAFSYIRSMFRGNAKPNRVSWLMWSIAPLIATVAGLVDGVTWAVIPVFMSGFSPLLILTFSFVAKNAYWKLTLFDYLCGICSMLALIFWAITKNPNIAISFAILSDGLAAVPTIAKGWSHPETENIFPYMAGFFGAITGFLAINIWTFSSYAFPSYLFLINIILMGSIMRKRFSQKIRNFTGH